MSAAPGKQEFQLVGSFDQFGLAEGALPPSLGPLAKLRLNLHSSSANWAILSEIFLKRASWELPQWSYQSPIFLLNTFATEINYMKNDNLPEKSLRREKISYVSGILIWPPQQLGTIDLDMIFVTAHFVRVLRWFGV